MPLKDYIIPTYIKRMKNIILLITFLIFTSQLKAQNYDLPRNPKAGKCYERCFDYDSKFK